MKCFKCGKDLENHNGDYTLKGLVVEFRFGDNTKCLADGFLESDCLGGAKKHLKISIILISN